MNLQDGIKRILVEEGIDGKYINAYLFGSARYKSDYNDVDLLITYIFLDYSTLLHLRQVLCIRLANLLQKEIDVVLLSVDEAKSTNFIIEEKCEIIL